MKTQWIRLIGVLVLFQWAGPAFAVEPGAGVNSAGIIGFPTALDQTRTHTFHLSIDVVDVGEPDLRFESLRYGLQLGNFQLLTEAVRITQPEREFDRAVMWAKLRVLPIDELRTDISLGVLGRYADTPEGEDRIDNRFTSLFLVVTNQAYLFGSLATLFNFYLDNLFVSFGFKTGVYQYVQVLGEVEYYHSMADLPDRGFGKLGVEIEGEQNFYFQLFYSERVDGMVTQIGTGF